MNGSLFRSLKTLPEPTGLVLHLPDLQHFHRILAPEQRLTRATLKRKGFRLFLSGWRGLVRAWTVGQRPANRHNFNEEKPNPQQNTRIAALSAALNADKGARARAVHLVVVEQTLVQNVFGGLNAVPVDVLKRAIPQLASLSSFRSCLELKLMLQCMHQIVETHVQLSKNQKEDEFHGHPGIDLMRRQPEPVGTQARIESSRRPSREPAESVVDDDDFPDTQDFSDSEVDIPLPMPPTDRGVAGSTWGK